MNYKILFVISTILILVFCCNNLLGQTLPSPNASSLGSAAGNPGGLYTGRPSIGIPLWTINGKSLTMPISLSYKTGGIRVEEIASWSGLGWSLNAGGVITRTVRGLPDDTPEKGYLHAGNLPDKSLPINNAAFDPYKNKELDGEPDLFFFNFTGGAGSFVISKEIEPGKSLYPLIYTVPQSNLKIRYTIDQTIKSWIITDTEGIKYTFTDKESLTFKDATGNEHTSSSWYLTKIEAPNQNEIIEITYEDYSIKYSLRDSQFKVYEKDPNSGQYMAQIQKTTYTQYISTNSKRLQEITLKRNNVLIEKVTFNKGSYERCDLVGDYPLTEILVSNLKGDLVKKYQFDYSYFSPFGNQPYNANCWSNEFDFHYNYLKDADGNDLGKRLRLDKITTFVGTNASEKTRPYTFQYSGPDLPSRYSYSQDHWGFYNGANNGGATNGTLIPSQVIDDYNNPGGPQITISGADRTVNSEYTKAASLKKVIYPSGASTTYEFETHDITANENKPGGLRIKRIIKNDGFSLHKDLVTEYAYVTETNKPSVLASTLPPYGYWMNKGTSSSEKQYYTSSTSTLPLTYTHGSTVGYTRVVVKSLDENQQNLGETVFKFNSFTDFPDQQAGYITLQAPPADNMDWKRGLLMEKEVYKLEGGVKTLISKAVNNYVHSGCYNTDDNSNECAEIDAIFIAKRNVEDNNSSPTIYKVEDTPVWYKVTSGISLLASVTNTVRLDDGSEKTTTVNHLYDNNYRLTKTTKTADGKVYESENIYPQEGDNGIQDALIEKNMLGTVIESRTYKEGAVISKSKSGFEQMSGNIVLKNIANTPTGIDANYEELQEFAYDSELNLVETHQSKGISNTIIWGFENTIPIAQVSNALLSEVAYTGFEYEGNSGNWNFSGGLFVEADAISGNNSYKSGNISKTLTLSSGSKKFRLSFWAKNGTPTVTLNGSTLSMQQEGTAGWVYYQNTSIDISNGQTLNIALGSNTQIDEVRLLPADAFMSTSAYDLNKGMITGADDNNIMNYYEYDAKNRLVRVKDFEGNIRKSYQYGEQLQLDFTLIPFDINGTNGIEKYEMSLEAVVSEGPSSGITYQWEINGSTATGGIVNHEFTTAGIYVIKLTAKHNEYITTTKEREVQIGTPALKRNFVVKSGDFSYNCQENALNSFTLEVQPNFAVEYDNFYTYQWYYNGSLIQNLANPAQITNNDITGFNNSVSDKLACVITNSFGDVIGRDDEGIPVYNVVIPPKEENWFVSCTGCNVNDCDTTPDEVTLSVSEFNRGLEPSLRWYSMKNGNTYPMSQFDGKNNITFNPTDIDDVGFSPAAPPYQIKCTFTDFCGNTIELYKDITSTCQ